MIKCVAIDDEPIALSIIQEYCKRHGDLEIHTFTSPVAGMEFIKNERPQIVFLDIEMNSHNGLELARELPADTCLIFTTAYSNYALEGFNVDAVDFLHKPIFYQRFERAIDKARKFLPVEKKPETIDSITLKVEHKTVVIKISDILYIEAMDNYVKIFRKDLPMILPQITMKEMEARLPSDRFLRVHRSYIVSVADIEKLSNRRIFLHSGKFPIPVGRKYIDAYKELQTNFPSQI